MTTVTFAWCIPQIPNGIITEYFLNVTNLETMTSRDYTIPVTPDQTFATQTVDASGFFRAYENYTATVTGRTHVGFGPMASTAGRTQPDSESVVSLSLISIVLFARNFLWAQLFLLFLSVSVLWIIILQSSQWCVLFLTYSKYFCMFGKFELQNFSLNRVPCLHSFTISSPSIIYIYILFVFL